MLFVPNVLSLDLQQPLRLCNVEENILHEIDETLQNELDKEEILRKVRCNTSLQKEGEIFVLYLSF